MNESAAAVQNPSPIIPAVPPAHRVKWRERHKKLYQCATYIFCPLAGGLPGAFMLGMVLYCLIPSQKFTAPELVSVVFIAAGITWVGLLLGAILACLTLLTEKYLADDSKTAHF